MAKVEIYTTRTCPYCIAAKKLLDKKKVDYTEYSVDNDVELRDAMTKRAGGATSVPQIFIDDAHIGGCDDLHDLERGGKLNPMLGADNGDNQNGPNPA